MHAGSVIVDLAAESGGNCELTRPGEEIVESGVTIVGTTNLPSTMATHASQLLSRNVAALVGLMVVDGAVALDWDDEVLAGTCVTRKGDRMSHNTLLVFEVTILVLAIFLGFEVISKVPTMLHTPLMSGTNAIHGIVIVGAMIVLGQPDKGAFTWVVGFAAVVLASANVVGGFVVTDRMLEMFKKREPPKPADAPESSKKT